jgi:large subunit ribosomal protein L30
MSTIKLKQVRSTIKCPADQKATIKALGFKKLNQIIEKESTPQIQGMVRKVKHLLEIISE